MDKEMLGKVAEMRLCGDQESSSRQRKAPHRAARYRQYLMNMTLDGLERTLKERFPSETDGGR